MNYHRLAEVASDLIVSQIRNNIGAALEQVATNTPAMGSLEAPNSYFLYEGAQGLELPAVFVIADDLDFNIAKNKANYISATAKFYVSVLVEDQELDLLTRRCFRYQSALHSVLDEALIISSDQELAIKVIVSHLKFSPVFKQGNSDNFRKEVVLECDVTHVENF